MKPWKEFANPHAAVLAGMFRVLLNKEDRVRMAIDNECDPFNVPEGFWPTTIAIHLGKRIG